MPAMRSAIAPIPARSPQALQRFSAWCRAQDHGRDAGTRRLRGTTFHITVEVETYATLARALGPLNPLWTGHTTPVLDLDRASPLAEEGAFRLP